MLPLAAGDGLGLHNHAGALRTVDPRGSPAIAAADSADVYPVTSPCFDMRIPNPLDVLAKLTEDVGKLEAAPSGGAASSSPSGAGEEKVPCCVFRSSRRTIRASSALFRSASSLSNA